MDKYVDKAGLQDFATKMNAKQKTIFALKSEVGSPLVAATAADMTDTDKVYVYTGSETGYTAGNWYYYDGSVWQSGGVYNSTAFTTDTTLSNPGEAADAKATGDAIGLSKYDGLLNIIKITDVNTTMGDIVSNLNSVNTAGDHVLFDVSQLGAQMYLCTIYIDQNFYRIADMVTGFEKSGFFKATDKLVDLMNGASTSGHHYTVKWNQTTAQCERLNDAANITTNITHFAHRGSVDADYSNPFDSIYPWSGRKLCNISIAAYMALQAGDDITDCVTYWEDEVGFDYDDANGVWVYTPAFFGKTFVAGNDRYFDVSDELTQGNISYPAMITGRWNGAVKSLTIGGVAKNCSLPIADEIPGINVALPTLHTYANNYNGTIEDIYALDASLLLMVVEYATLDSQTACGNGVSNLYRQSADKFAEGSTGTVVKVTAANASAVIPGAIMDIGTSDGSYQVARCRVISTETVDAIKNVTLNQSVTVTTDNYWSIHGKSNTKDADIGSKSGYIGVNGQSIAYYRGEQLWANQYRYILGAYRQTGTQKVWIAARGESDSYDALNTSHHIDTGIVLPDSGYIGGLGIASGLSLAPFANAIGGNSSNPVGDYYYVPAASAGNTILLLGGNSSYGANDGAFTGYWNTGASYSSWYFSARPVLKNP